MRILRKLLLLGAALALLAFGVVLTVNNPEPIPLDIGLMRFESLPVPVAFAGVFAAGWLFGVACAAPGLVRLAAERRRLRRELRSSRTSSHAREAASAHAD